MTARPSPMDAGLALAAGHGHTMGPVEQAGPMGSSIRSTCSRCGMAVIVTTSYPTGSATFYGCSAPGDPSEAVTRPPSAASPPTNPTPTLF